MASAGLQLLLQAYGTFEMDESVLRWSNDMDISVCEKEIRGFLDNERRLHTYPAKFKK